MGKKKLIVSEIDYEDKLSPEEKEWLKMFNSVSEEGTLESIGDLIDKAKELKKKVTK